MGVDFLLRNGKKILIFTAIIASLALALTTLIDFVGTQATTALNSMGLSFVPMFAPSNLGTCLAIVISVKTAGTVYESTLQLIKWKVDTLA
jgi:flagellar biosynthesis protein FliQ